MQILNEMLRARAVWDELTPAEQAQAICTMVDAGHAEDVVATATGLNVEMIRQILADRAAS